MAVIPGDVFDMAVDECRQTLTGSNDSPLKDRIVKMLDAFSSYGVTKEMIEAKLGHNVDAIIETQFIDLISIYNSIKDGMGSRDDFFKVGPKTGDLINSVSDEPEEPTKMDELKEAIKLHQIALAEFVKCNKEREQLLKENKKSKTLDQLHDSLSAELTVLEKQIASMNRVRGFPVESEEEPKQAESTSFQESDFTDRVNWNKLSELCAYDKIPWPEVQAWASSEGRNINLDTEEGCQKILNAWESVKEAIQRG